MLRHACETVLTLGFEIIAHSACVVLQLLKNLRRSVTTLDICGQWGEKGDEATLVHFVLALLKRQCHASSAHHSESRRASFVGSPPSAWLLTAGDGNEADLDAGACAAETPVDTAGEAALLVCFCGQ